MVSNFRQLDMAYRCRVVTLFGKLTVCIWLEKMAPVQTVSTPSGTSQVSTVLSAAKMYRFLPEVSVRKFPVFLKWGLSAATVTLLNWKLPKIEISYNVVS